MDEDERKSDSGTPEEQNGGPQEEVDDVALVSVARNMVSLVEGILSVSGVEARWRSRPSEEPPPVALPMSDSGQEDADRSMEGGSRQDDARSSQESLQNWIAAAILLRNSALREQACGNMYPLTEHMEDYIVLLRSNALHGGIRCDLSADLLTCVYRVSVAANSPSSILLLEEASPRRLKDQFVTDLAFEWLRCRTCRCHNEYADVPRLVWSCRHLLLGMPQEGVGDPRQGGVQLTCQNLSHVLEMTYLLESSGVGRSGGGPNYIMPSRNSFDEYVRRSNSIQANAEEFTLGDTVKTPATNVERMLLDHSRRVHIVDQGDAPHDGALQRWRSVGNDCAVSVLRGRICCFCQEEYQEGTLAVVLPGCAHTFHAEASDCLGDGQDPPVLTYFRTKNRCPECRKAVVF